MFKKLELGNFKRFQNTEIDLKKINIIVGPNNSGKSSLISAFRLICQTLDSYDDQVTLLLNGPFGDFGTFRDIIYKNHRGRPLEINLELDINTNFKDPSETCRVRLELVFKYSQDDREVYAQSVKIYLDGEHLIESKYSLESKKYNIERIGNTKIPPSLKSSIAKEFRFRHFFPLPLFPRLGILYPEKKGAYADFLEKFNASPDALCIRKINIIWGRLSRTISKTDYLGPLRIAPSRTYLFTGERSKRIGIAGENLTSIIATKNRRNDRQEETSIHEKINHWLQKSEMAKESVLVPITDRHFEIRIKNYFTKEDQNIADVGFGHSQVLPFLAGGLALPENSTYFAEQPELHLHPKAQAELGDYLLNLYERSVQTLIETHSEHLILRIQQHVASGAISHDDIRIIYVGNAETDINGNPINEVICFNLDENGQFDQPWPRGFFPEKLDESKKLAKIRLQRNGLPVRAEGDSK